MFHATELLFSKMVGYDIAMCDQTELTPFVKKIVIWLNKKDFKNIFPT
jgi:hypothetical protein